MLVVVTYLIYLAGSVALTVWVAHSRSSNGLVFLVDSFDGHEALARSVNHLPVDGFYLPNLGYVALALEHGTRPADVPEAIEFLSTKIGFVLLGSLCISHARLRRRDFASRQGGASDV